MNDNPDLFNFDKIITLKQFMEDFDNGINSFNNKIDVMKITQNEIDKNNEKINNKIKLKNVEDTYDRGSVLLQKKLNDYDYILKILYNAHKITLVILSFIVIIMLIYKLLNR